MRCGWKSGVRAPACRSRRGHRRRPRPGCACCTRHLLPTHPAFLGDTPEMTIALRGLGLSRLARYRRGARWHNDRNVRITIRDGPVNTVTRGQRRQDHQRRVVKPVRLGSSVAWLASPPSLLNSVQNFPDSGGKQRPIVSTLGCGGNAVLALNGMGIPDQNTTADKSTTPPGGQQF